MQPLAQSTRPARPRSTARRLLRRERRAHPRHAAAGLRVWSPRLRAHVLDISASGLRLSTTSRLAAGEQLTFHLISEQPSIATGVVRWCRLDSVFEAAGGRIESVYHVGLALLHEPRRLELPR